MSNKLAGNLRKACRRRGLKLRVFGGRAEIHADSLVWTGALTEGMAWLSAAHPSQVGRPIMTPANVAPLSRRLSDGARTLPSLAKDDPGEDSEDMTPADAQGWVETEVALPVWLSGDAALIALWACEWRRARAPIIGEGLRAARRALGEATEVRLITLSDADRASLAEYPGTPSEVFTAAALSPRRGRQIGR